MNVYFKSCMSDIVSSLCVSFRVIRICGSAEKKATIVVAETLFIEKRISIRRRLRITIKNEDNKY